jgi:sulfite exporter TauE/SafE/copper chaperone CopZ
MVCAACEVRVAKALRALPGVSAARVSARTERAEVASNHRLDPAQVAAAVAQAGYTVGTAPKPWFSHDKSAWRDVLVAAAVLGAAVLAWRAGGLSRVGDAAGRAAAGGNLVFIALLGAAASLSTCMALVGGLVVGLSARYAARCPSASGRQLLQPQLLFNLGRVAGFTVLGAATGALGSVFSLQGRLLGAALAAVAIVMGLLGLKLTGLFPRLDGVAIALPAGMASWLRRGRAADSYRSRDGFLLGVASFFLPCGFTQAVQVYALSTGSPLQAGLALGLFALGSAPGLMGLGSLASLAKGRRQSARFFRCVGVAVVGFALLNAVGGLRLIAPGLTAADPAAPAARTANVFDADGLQTARITVDPTGYSPSETVVYAGQPTRWVFDLTGLSCASTVDFSNLGLAQTIRLRPGENSVETAAAEPGTYLYTCGMGMFLSTVYAIPKPD